MECWQEQFGVRTCATVPATEETLEKARSALKTDLGFTLTAYRDANGNRVLDIHVCRDCRKSLDAADELLGATDFGASASSSGVEPGHEDAQLKEAIAASLETEVEQTNEDAQLMEAIAASLKDEG